MYGESSRSKPMISNFCFLKSRIHKSLQILTWMDGDLSRWHCFEPKYTEMMCIETENVADFMHYLFVYNKIDLGLCLHIALLIYE